jgi:hypothetical protein
LRPLEVRLKHAGQLSARNRQAWKKNCRTNHQLLRSIAACRVVVAELADCSCQRPRWATLHELVKPQTSGAVISRNSPQAWMADVKRQRLLTEAAGRMPSQDHTLERHLTLTPPTSGSVASRFMTEKSAFGVFGGASGRRNGRYTGSGRDARDILRSSAMRGKCRDERDEGNNNGTARMLVFECRPPGGAAGYVRGGCSQAARLTFPSIASVCLRGGAGLWCLGRPGTKVHSQQRQRRPR